MMVSRSFHVANMVVDRKEKLLLKMLVKFKSAFSHVYTLWGPKDNLVISSTAGVHDAHFNTNGGKIIIGDRVFFGKGVSILTGTHDYNKFGADRISAYAVSDRDVVIKDGVWVASNATIIGPCIIGENAVIGAGSVVLGDVEPYTIVAGNPARVIRKIQH